MKKLLTLVIGASLLISCSKDNTDNTNSNLTATNFNQLNVNADFNWISGTESSITVEVLQPLGFPLNLENQQIWVLNSDGKRIAFSSLNSNHRAQFQLVVPDNHDAYEFYLPATNESWEVQWKSTQTLQLKDPLDASSFKGKQRGKTNFRSKTIQANNLLGNADFETTISPSNVNVSSFSPITSTVDDGQWRVSNNLFSQISQGGSTVITPGNGVNYMWQNITVNPGDSIIFDADYQGNVFVYLWFWNYNGSSAGLIGYTANSLYAVPNGLEAVVPNNASVVTALILFGSGSVSSGDYFDNAYLGIPSAVADSDNDGVADDLDEYPNDPSRAFTSYWPSEGRATIMYEDLWPSTGDYDFNDMVINAKITMYHDASGAWVSADYEVALDAVGAGIDNSLAVRYVNSARSPITNTVTGVTGDARIDPDVTNGIIIFDRPSDLQSSYYTNTSSSSTAKPDTAKFTVTFNGSYNNTYLPDFYIYRSDNRGHEIHVASFSGTNMADASLNNTEDDVNGTYRTSNGLPWALGLIWSDGNFEIPMEQVDFLEAYPEYALYTNSNASTNTDWYKRPAANKTIDLLGL